MKKVLRYKFRVLLIALALVYLILYVFHLPGKGEIRVVFVPGGMFNDPACRMIIKPDGTVTAKTGKHFPLYSGLGFGIPILSGDVGQREGEISAEDYEFLYSMMYQKERPNLKEDVFPSWNTSDGNFMVISTRSKWYNIALLKSILMDGIYDEVYEFHKKIYEVCPFDLVDVSDWP